MSVLHDPGPGEILDRLTILSLKVVYGTQAGRDISHWKAEQETLADKFWKTPAGTSTVQARGLIWMELAAVNAALWQAEDALRALRDRYKNTDTGVVAANFTVGDVEAGFQIGFRVQSLNDRRAALVTLINTNAGIDRPADKL